ncbi:MAG TPA: methyltransferase domain-containing protein [Steroidobacteraceae bacterium]|nr:methyltransferase domain-containing protein [Steroidobacteraceae bacterium]
MTRTLFNGGHTADAADTLVSEARQRLQAMDFAEAEHLLRRAIGLNPSLRAAYELLGKLLYRDSRSDEAAAVYRQWLEALPADPIAAHLVAATGGAPAPIRASDDFVADLFGRAAPGFDAALANLGYRAPQLLFEQAERILAGPPGPPGHAGPATLTDPAATSGPVALMGAAARAGPVVVDLGCGTGLCGALLRPLASRLVGVDLSPEMLDEARARGCYDELICGEITAIMQGCSERFDLIVAADVLCYFGELTRPLSAARACLRSGGWIVFSVEEWDGWDRTKQPLQSEQTPEAESSQEAGSGTPRFTLLEHGRYAHTATYVADILSAAGFSQPALSRDMLRFERGAPVEGLIVSACRPPLQLITKD